MLSAYEIMKREERLDAIDAYSIKAEKKAEEYADEYCDMFGMEGDERSAEWDRVYYAEYDRLMDEYEKTL